MDKYDGIRQIAAVVRRSNVLDGIPQSRMALPYIPELSAVSTLDTEYEENRESLVADSFRRETEPPSVVPSNDKSVTDKDKSSKRTDAPFSPIRSFFLRGVAASLLLGILFLPKVYPYEGSDKVTEIAKTVVATDISMDEKIGEGKLPDAVRKLYDILCAAIERYK